MSNGFSKNMEGTSYELARRLDLAFRKEPRPTVEAVLAESARYGVLRGSIYTVFEKWRMFINSVLKRAERELSLSHDDARSLIAFAKELVELLNEAEKKTRDGLAALYDDLRGGNTRVWSRGKTTYICSGEVCIKAHMSKDKTLKVFTLSIGTSGIQTYFPDLLKLPEEEYTALQLGWRASDETAERNKACIRTTQPWQLIAWLATRPGDARVHLHRVNINAKGLSLQLHIVAKNWEQRWSKEEAQSLAIEALQKGDYRPLLTWFLGDGIADWTGLGKTNPLRISVGKKRATEIANALRGTYSNRIVETYGNTARTLAKTLVDSAGRYALLLNHLSSHKWEYLKALANSKPAFKPTYVTINGIEMRLHLSAKTLHAVKYFTNEEEARQALDKLKTYAKLYKDRQWYVLYIPWANLKELAKDNHELSQTVIHFLTSKNKPLAKKLLHQFTSIS